MMNNENAHTATAIIACALATALVLNPAGAALALPVPTNQARANATQIATIGAKEARNIALRVAQFAKKQHHLLDAELDIDRDDVPAHYDTFFTVGDREYQCDINAITGEVISYFVEIDC